MILHLLGDGRRDWCAEQVRWSCTPLTLFLPSSRPSVLFSLPLVFPSFVSLIVLHSIRLITARQAMSGADKGIMAHEVGLDPSAQDDRDMERLGKVQEFKVGLM